MSSLNVKIEILKMSVKQKSIFLLDSAFFSFENKKELRDMAKKIFKYEKIEDFEFFNEYLNDMIKIVKIEQEAQIADIKNKISFKSQLEREKKSNWRRKKSKNFWK